MNLMKQTFFLTALSIIAFGGSGCKKDQVLDQVNNTIELAADETVDAQIDSLGAFMEDPVVTDADETQDALIQSLPEIFDNDYFTFVESEGPQGGDRMEKRDSLLKLCSSAIRIGMENKEALKRAHLAKLECMKHNRMVMHKADSMVRAWAMNHRKELLTQHEITVREIQGAFKAGKITEKERDAKLAAAKMELAKALKGIRAGVKERLAKMMDRAEAAGKIKDCERIYLNTVKEILGKENFAKWIKCHKYRYRKGK